MSVGQIDSHLWILMKMPSVAHHVRPDLRRRKVTHPSSHPLAQNKVIPVSQALRGTDPSLCYCRCVYQCFHAPPLLTTASPAHRGPEGLPSFHRCSNCLLPLTFGAPRCPLESVEPSYPPWVKSLQRKTNASSPCVWPRQRTPGPDVPWDVSGRVYGLFSPTLKGCIYGS